MSKLDPTRTAGELKAFLDSIPDHASVSVDGHQIIFWAPNEGKFAEIGAVFEIEIQGDVPWGDGEGT